MLSLRQILFGVLLGWLFAMAGVVAAPLNPDDVPEPLAPWVDWVLTSKPGAACPVRFDDDTRECLWPTPLVARATTLGFGFRQAVHVYGRTAVGLPGGVGQWPQLVSVNDQTVSIVEKDGRPTIWLDAGQHDVVGWIPWSRIPDSVSLPQSLASLDLQIDGKPVVDPVVRGGKLWLREQPKEPSNVDVPEDSLRLVVVRLLADGHPAQLTTEIRLTVSGAAREITAGKPVPEGFTALRLNSPLPARLEPDGRLRVQVRPGDWVIRVISRRIGVLNALNLAEQARPWPASEVVAFAASRSNRTIRVLEGDQVDPRRTDLPEKWHRYPAYRVDAGQRLRFETLRRGNPEPDPDQLNLQRSLWLDFDGWGYTVRDNISGKLTRTWRLSIDPSIRLGQVALDGQAQFITTLADDRLGVEVRRGDLRLRADSRLPRDGALYASGWDVPMQSAGAELHTPPGWRVVTVSGVDSVSGAWFEAWTLFDLFFVLLISIAVARLWGFHWAAMMLIGLALMWHEPNAPRFVWLAVIAALALYRLVPANGRFNTIVRGLLGLAWVALAVQALPFAVDQARLALYPQLENAGYTEAVRPQQIERRVNKQEALVADEASVAERAPATMSRSRGVSSYALPSPAVKQKNVHVADPNAIVQTGPGLPAWQWRRTRLSWNGPVTPGQKIEPWLLSPWFVSGLRLLALIVLGALVWRMIRTPGSGKGAAPHASQTSVPPSGSGEAGSSKAKKRTGNFKARGRSRSASAGASAAFVLAMPSMLAAGLIGLSLHADVRAEALPSKALLDELASRLLAQPHEAPRASLARLTIAAPDADTLTLALQVHTLQRTAVPLPIDASQSWPVSISVNGASATAKVLRARDDRLWMLLDAGQHAVSIRLRVPDRQTVSLPMPLRAQQVRLQGDRWTVSGLSPQGVPGEQIVLTRRPDKAGSATPQPSQEARLAPGRLPALLQVTRTLSLGLRWQVRTQIQRLSPRADALTVPVALLPGEAVISEGIAVKDGMVRAVLPAGTRSIEWLGSIEPVDQLELQASESERLVERWRLDVGTIWHVQHDGLAPILHQDNRRRWLPTWHPWPGETLRLAIARPSGAAGQTLTIDSSQLSLTPGEQRLNAELSFKVRSSQGVRHAITLPAGANLQWVRINGRSQALQIDDRTLILPLDPGPSQVALRWHTEASMERVWRTPEIDLGIDSVNAKIQVTPPAARWVVALSGPSLGPAVLFWGMLLVVVVLALALGRVGKGILPIGVVGWLLIGIGFMQTSLLALLPLVAWLALIHIRATKSASWSPLGFNAIQVLIVGLSVVMAGVLFFAVQQSLLGWPDMQIIGNGSSARQLNWYADRSGTQLPVATIVSLPLIIYRGLMLLWALWLAFSALAWLRWAWPRFAEGGLWRTMSWRSFSSSGAAAESEAASSSGDSPASAPKPPNQVS